VSTPIAIALSSSSTPSLRLSVPARGSRTKSFGHVSGNASDVTCDRGRWTTDGRWAAAGRWILVGRDGATAPPLLEGATVVTGGVTTWTIRGVVSVGVDETTTGRLLTVVFGVETRDWISACGAGSGDGWPD
jgi:hypothetical protein